ncbi:LysM peptidoglycan-binding domain-containing protein [Thioclava sp. 'Guangxiensis']|uniref:LysM peptidoglycan-binding domain-containing protein n=1 Tax=Thioclava sp. 'Guangxiensis' TaxID=3149044 RepID=UPI003877B2E4
MSNISTTRTVIGAGVAAVAVLLVLLGTQRSVDPVQESGASPEPAKEVRAVDGVTQAASSQDMPAPQTPEMSEDPDMGRFDNLHVASDGAVTLAGRAAPDARVEILVDGEVMAEARSDADGAFATQFDVVPSGEPQSVGLRITPAGQAPVESPESLQIAPLEPQALASATSDATMPANIAQPASSVASAPEADMAAAPVSAVTEPPRSIVTDATSARVLGPALDHLAIDTLSYDPQGEVVIAGRGLAEDAQLVIYLDNKQVALSTPAARDKTGWQLSLPDIAPGTYQLRVDAVDADGKVVSRAETPFLRETPESLANAVADRSGEGTRILTVQPGNTLWAIARETYGDGFLYVRVFDANRDQIRNPDLIYPGQVFNLPR